MLLFRKLFLLMLLLFTPETQAFGSCEKCGFLKRMMSKDGKCECVFLIRIFLGYSCDGCSGDGETPDGEDKDNGGGSGTSSGDGSDSTSGYCNWGPDGTGATSTCDGKTGGGEWCNANASNCENCQGRWCIKDEGSSTGGGDTDESDEDTGGTDGGSSNPTLHGEMTMWTESSESIKSSSCELAHDATVKDGSSWLNPYVRNNRYCALSSGLHQNGLGCGKCYLVSYDGEGGTESTPGRAGSAIIQAVDSGSAHEFDCFVDVFEEITGHRTGRFPVEYKEVDCIEDEVGPTAVILDKNSYYTKVLFAGGPSGVRAASIIVGSKTHHLNRGGGATWTASLDGDENVPIRFTVEFDNDEIVSIAGPSNQGCFGGVWPVEKSTQCSST